MPILHVSLVFPFIFNPRFHASFLTTILFVSDHIPSANPVLWAGVPILLQNDALEGACSPLSLKVTLRCLKMCFQCCYPPASAAVGGSNVSNKSVL